MAPSEAAMTPRMHPVLLPSSLVAAAWLTCCGCTGHAEVRLERSASAVSLEIIPTLTTRPGTLRAQRKGDLLAMLLPEPCPVTVVELREARRAADPACSLADRRRYLVTTCERLEFDPDRFTFRIALTDVGGLPLRLPAVVGVEYRLNGIPVDVQHSWGPCQLDGEIAPDASTFVRFELPRVGDLRDGDEVLVALRGLNIGHGQTADFVWCLRIAAERTVELRSSTGSEWR
jgi:hypothetical protein